MHQPATDGGVPLAFLKVCLSDSCKACVPPRPSLHPPGWNHPLRKGKGGIPQVSDLPEMIHSLLFISLSVILTIDIVLKNVKLLGYFPTTAGILTTISTRVIKTDGTLNYKRHLTIHFGQYFQIY